MSLSIPVDVLRESSEGNTGVIVVEHVNVRIQYERIAWASVLRQNYKIQQLRHSTAVQLSTTRHQSPSDGQRETWERMNVKDAIVVAVVGAAVEAVVGTAAAQCWVANVCEQSRPTPVGRVTDNG